MDGAEYAGRVVVVGDQVMPFWVKYIPAAITAEIAPS